MERYRLARKKWPLALVGLVCAGVEGALFVAVTRPALEAARAGRALEGEWSWLSIWGWHAAVALLGAALAWQPLAELLTVFTPEGVSRPRLFGRPTFVAWAEAESVFVAPGVERPHTVRVNAPGRSVELNALFYKDTAALLALIEGRMRAFSAAPSAAPSCARLAAD